MCRNNVSKKELREKTELIKGGHKNKRKEKAEKTKTIQSQKSITAAF